MPCFDRLGLRRKRTSRFTGSRQPVNACMRSIVRYRIVLLKLEAVIILAASVRVSDYCAII
jgi:hypothetical protein